MAKKKGFMARIIEGPERSENYARSTLPSNRWQLGWDIFKTNFSKLVLLNVILLLFVLPVIAIVVFRDLNVRATALEFPFESFMSYPYIASLNGIAETIEMRSNLTVLAFLPIAAVIVSVGLSGVLYILRNMVWTEGVFVGSDFWRGVKKNFGIVTAIMVCYSVFMYLAFNSLSSANYLIAVGAANEVLLTIGKVLSYVLMIFITMIAMHMLTMSVTYELGFFKLLKNAFILTVSLLPTNVFFMAFALITLILYLISSSMGFLVILLFALIGMTGGLLVWTVYSHWIYDKFINEKVPGAKRNRGIYEKPGKESFGDDLLSANGAAFDTVYLNKRPVKPVTDYDVEIVELPTSFNREDLRRLEESKEAMRRDSDQYVEDVLSGKIKPASISSFIDDEEAAEDASAEDTSVEASIEEADAQTEQTEE